jgi:hypothetical protein
MNRKRSSTGLAPGPKVAFWRRIVKPGVRWRTIDPCHHPRSPQNLLALRRCFQCPPWREHTPVAVPHSPGRARRRWVGPDGGKLACHDGRHRHPDSSRVRRNRDKLRGAPSGVGRNLSPASSSLLDGAVFRCKWLPLRYDEATRQGANDVGEQGLRPQARSLHPRLGTLLRPHGCAHPAVQLVRSRDHGLHLRAPCGDERP